MLCSSTHYPNHTADIDVAVATDIVVAISSMVTFPVARLPGESMQTESQTQPTRVLRSSSTSTVSPVVPSLYPMPEKSGLSGKSRHPTGQYITAIIICTIFISFTLCMFPGASGTLHFMPSVTGCAVGKTVDWKSGYSSIRKNGRE